MAERRYDIVLVEDSHGDIDWVLEALKQQGIENRVKVLHDGDEAVQYICRTGTYSDCESCTPRLIILDLKLPKVSGLDVLGKIRENERTKSTPVVIFSDSARDEEITESFSLGANSFIEKPAKLEDFVNAVAQIGFYWAVLNTPPQTDP